MAALRPLLAQTRLEKAKLNLIYDAVKDGWKKADFHRKVDNRGASLVVARTRGGAVCGGFNPEVSGRVGPSCSNPQSQQYSLGACAREDGGSLPVG